jgi:hypothetical protein
MGAGFPANPDHQELTVESAGILARSAPDDRRRRAEVASVRSGQKC